LLRIKARCSRKRFTLLSEKFSFVVLSILRQKAPAGVHPTFVKTPWAGERGSGGAGENLQINSPEHFFNLHNWDAPPSRNSIDNRVPFTVGLPSRIGESE